jgi:hypothetical protein
MEMIGGCVGEEKRKFLVGIVEMELCGKRCPTQREVIDFFPHSQYKYASLIGHCLTLNINSSLRVWGSSDQFTISELALGTRERLPYSHVRRTWYGSVT